MKCWMTCLILVLGIALVVDAPAQEGVVVQEPLAVETSGDLQDFRARVEAAHPDMDIVSISGSAVAQLAPRPVPAVNPRVAIFGKNQSTRRQLDDEIDPMRDMVGAELAGRGMIILDPQDIVAGFHRYKVTTAEERAGLIDGLFTGGSAVRVAQMIGADYLVLIKLLSVDVRQRGNINTYNTMISVSVLEAATGSSVDGGNYREAYPSNAARSSASEMTYFRDLLYDTAEKIGSDLASKSATWRQPDAVDTRMVSFTVRTTMDQLVDGLENGVRAPNELLDEMRRMVGGVTVELNGAALGSAPGTFKALPGMHQLRVTRQWMEPWQRTVQIYDGAEFSIGLELSNEGLAKFQSLEGFRALAALSYAEAAYRKGIKINFDTQNWRDVAIGNRGNEINLEKREIRQEGVLNQAIQ